MKTVQQVKSEILRKVAKIAKTKKIDLQRHSSNAVQLELEEIDHH